MIYLQFLIVVFVCQYRRLFVNSITVLWTPVDFIRKLYRRREYLKLLSSVHDDVIKWKDFPRYWPFVRGIHRSLVNSPHKGQWRGDLVFSLSCAWINDWVNSGEAGDLRRHRAHYDATVMLFLIFNFNIIYSYQPNSALLPAARHSPDLPPMFHYTSRGDHQSCEHATPGLWYITHCLRRG